MPDSIDITNFTSNWTARRIMRDQAIRFAIRHRRVETWINTRPSRARQSKKEQRNKQNPAHHLR